MKLMGLFVGFLFLIVAGIPAAEPAAKSLSVVDLPAAAQKTIRQQIGKSEITAIEKQSDDGEVSYDLDFLRNGEERSLSVADNGTLLSIVVGLLEVPAPVRNTINQQLKGGSLDLIEKTFDENEIIYEVEMTRGKAERSLTLDGNGKLLRLQIDLAEAPKAVQKTIGAKGGQSGDIFRVFEDNTVSYECEITKDGQDREINVAENAHLESIEVTLNEVPAPARKTISNRMAAGRIERIDKCFNDKDAVTFEVSGKKDGKRFEFKVGPRGRFLGVL